MNIGTASNVNEFNPLTVFCITVIKSTFGTNAIPNNAVANMPYAIGSPINNNTIKTITLNNIIIFPFPPTACQPHLQFYVLWDHEGI